MKKLMLVSMIAAAAIFTACDDDDSAGDVYSCDINLDMGVLGSMRTCVEASDKAKVTDACKQVNDMMAELNMSDVGKTGSGCPSGATKTCSDTQDGVAYTAYFYDEDSAKEDCKDLLKDKEELGF